MILFAAQAQRVAAISDLRWALTGAFLMWLVFGLVWLMSHVERRHDEHVRRWKTNRRAR